MQQRQRCVADLPLSCPMPGMYLWNSHPRVYLPIESSLELSAIAARSLLLAPGNRQALLDRTSMNTWEDQAVIDKVNEIGKPRIVLAGLWTSVCIVGPALSALDQGFEVFVIADRITVLRDGTSIITKSAADTSKSDVIKHMVGREINDLFPRRASTPGDVIFEARNLTDRKSVV